jgi:hypothetical protein
MLPLLPLIAGGLQVGQQLASAFGQKQKANNVKLQNTTTNGEREALAMSRQATNTSRLPGMGGAMNRLGMVQAGALQNARLGAASSSDFLASAGAADARRQQGEQQLAERGLAYQDASKQQLRRDLATQSAREQHDLDAYNAQKGALTQASNQNLASGLNTAASYGALAYNMGANMDAAGNTGQVADMGYDPISTRTPALTGRMGITPLPTTLPGYAGRSTNFGGLGNRRYARMGYNPNPAGY